MCRYTANYGLSFFITIDITNKNVQCVILWKGLLPIKCAFLYAYGRVNVCMIEPKCFTQRNGLQLCFYTDCHKGEGFRRPSELDCYCKAER
jgi:hypothetical protein